MKIKIDKAEIKELSESISLNSLKTQDLVKTLEDITISLGYSWSGDSFVKFSQKINDNYVKTLSQFAAFLEEYSVYLKNAGNFYQTLEDTFAQKKIDI